MDDCGYAPVLSLILGSAALFVAGVAAAVVWQLTK